MFFFTFFDGEMWFVEFLDYLHLFYVSHISVEVISIFSVDGYIVFHMIAYMYRQFK